MPSARRERYGTITGVDIDVELAKMSAGAVARRVAWTDTFDTSLSEKRVFKWTVRLNKPSAGGSNIELVCPGVMPLCVFG